MDDGLLISVRVAGRRCVVLGEGDEAIERARRFADAGGEVDLYALGTPRPEALPDGIRWFARDAALDELDGAFVVVSTHRDPTRSSALFARAIRPGGYLLCCVDQPEFCTFTNVAIARCGPLRIGIGTSGAAPGLSRLIRERTERALGPDLDRFLDQLVRLRDATPREQRREVFARALAGFDWAVHYEIPPDEAERALPSTSDGPMIGQKLRSGG